MALDRITEEIAHFAGLFHLEIEAAKLRLDYLGFRNTTDAPALDPLQDDPFAGQTSLPESTVKTSLTRKDAPPPPKGPEAPAMSAQQPAAPQGPQMATALPDPLPTEGEMVAMSGLSVSARMIEVLPNSVVMSIAQTAFLSDNDLLIFDGSASFTDPALFLSLMQDLGELAHALRLIDPWTWDPEAGPVLAAAQHLAEAMQALTPAQIDGATSIILRGEEASGIFINGEKVAEAPALTDLMPAFLKPAPETAPEFGDSAPPSRTDGTTDHDPSPFAVDPGHHVVTGGNRVINETVVKSVWVDAPVIAVAHEVLRLDVISQVNLRIEAAALPDKMTAAPSVSYNIARLEQSAAPAQPAASAAMDKTLPAIWNVTRLEGDLVLMNWVQQHIFVSDYDRIEVTFSGAATYLGLGENLVFNEALLKVLGFHYDLIMVGGSMITLNQITQINVLLDQDSIGGDVPAGASLSAGDNLQVNTAAIVTTGQDSTATMADHFATALSELAAGARTVSADVAQDALFAGKSALNILYINGDLIQTNVIEQVNYLGDSDQIHFIQDMFSTAAGAEVTVTSGSNAQINAATITTQGKDSVIMAGGDIYSDALIHQAELIDEAAPPVGVQLGKLAPEAVAFLADDMIAPAPSEDCGPGIALPDSPGTADVMQTMLA
jgi:hypothetical protein